ncbi:MAG: ISNCY family transposase [Methanobrevibacter sp.]|nr:ISNCY family transposase [Methanobrevibacter sp.]
MINSAVKKHKDILPLYVKGLYNNKYTLKQAAESTGYTIEHLCRLKKKYAQYGNSIFVHKNKYRVPKNKTASALKQKIARIYASDYADINFSYFNDCLKAYENINLSTSTVAKILKEFGFKSPEGRKIKKKLEVHRPRVRREYEGDLMQVDGTPYAWFYKFGDNKKYCLSGGIDDATGKLTGLYLTENECLYGYLEVLRQTCNTFGVPRQIYSDRAAIFCHTPKGKNLAQWEKLEVMHEKRTQWQRICEDLNISQVLAWSPQAKGRIERAWRTIQGQLPMWLYKNNVKTVDDANKVLNKYIEFFNNKYSVAPFKDDDVFYLDPPANLDDILCAQFSRHVDKDGCITFQNTVFYAPTAPDISRRDIILCINENGIFAKYLNKYYPLVPVGKTVQQTVSDHLPQVVINIIYRYLYAFAKEVSC